MNCHDKIMNIPADAGESHDYKRGHRDARHRAAEIAQELDAQIEALKEQLAEAHGRSVEPNDRVADDPPAQENRQSTAAPENADPVWTVVRFPNGDWSTGGRPDSPDYEHCEIWQIPAPSAEKAKKKAQGKRSRAARQATRKDAS